MFDLSTSNTITITIIFENKNTITINFQKYKFRLRLQLCNRLGNQRVIDFIFGKFNASQVSIIEKRILIK